MVGFTFTPSTPSNNRYYLDVVPTPAEKNTLCDCGACPDCCCCQRLWQAFGGPIKHYTNGVHTSTSTSGVTSFELLITESTYCGAVVGEVLTFDMMVNSDTRNVAFIASGTFACGDAYKFLLFCGPLYMNDITPSASDPLYEWLTVLGVADPDDMEPGDYINGTVGSIQMFYYLACADVPYGEVEVSETDCSAELPAITFNVYVEDIEDCECCNAPVFGCSNCPIGAPTKYELLVSGVTNGSCSSCASFNELQLVYFGSGCVWVVTDPCGWLTTLTMESVGSARLVLHSNSGTVVEYISDGLTFNCWEPSVLHRVAVFGAICNDWPATVTIQPYLAA